MTEYILIWLACASLFALLAMAYDVECCGGGGFYVYVAICFMLWPVLILITVWTYVRGVVERIRG